jgi:hypothetical protein
MERTELLKWAGVAGVVVGGLTVVAGSIAGELGQLAAGYGLLLLLASGYLLGGLAVRTAVRRARERRHAAAPVSVATARR